MARDNPIKATKLNPERRNGMAKKTQSAINNSKKKTEELAVRRESKTQALMNNGGIRSSSDILALMSCTIQDMVNNQMTPAIGNVVIRATTNIIKTAELQLRYGKRDAATANTIPVLELSAS
jgi:hypothetical protein